MENFWYGLPEEISTSSLKAESLHGILEIDESILPRFETWRPRIHVAAVKGWMNDPCGFFHDKQTGLFHLFFECNPYGSNWGNMSWGHAVSSDFVSWKVFKEPSLTPSESYDREGVFTGCQLPPTTDQKSNVMTVVYTSVSNLPIHYTLPYVYGSETLSFAESLDGGKTWSKFPQNPVIKGPPSHNVTGWRDPYVSYWPAMDQVLYGSKGHAGLYGIISGGIAKETPTVFIYSIDKDNLTDWQYIGSLIDIGQQFSKSRWTGDFGLNWEVVNFMSLTTPDHNISHEFLIMGAEGLRSHAFTSPATLMRPNRGQMWMCGSLKSKDDGDVKMKFRYGGYLDHGSFYAANSSFDSLTQRHILWGWIPEDDLPDTLRDYQNWAGCISLPRILKLLVIENVCHTIGTSLHDIGSLEATVNEAGSFTVYTLGISPASETSLMRKLASYFSLPPCLNFSKGGLSRYNTGVRHLQWELTAQISVGHNCSKVGLIIAHSRDLKRRSVVYFSPSDETITVDRSLSAASWAKDSGINLEMEIAPHTLFVFKDPVTGKLSNEKLNLHVLYDQSVLEIFVNERTCITTRLYSDTQFLGLSLFAEGDSSSHIRNDEIYATFHNTQVWSGLKTNIEAI